jgi:hypothetical protein
LASSANKSNGWAHNQNGSNITMSIHLHHPHQITIFLYHIIH